MERRSRVEVPSVLLVVFTVSLTTGVFAPLLPAIQDDFNLTATTLTLILAVFGIARLLIDVPAGRLLKLYSPSLLLTAGDGAAAIGLVGAVLAPTYEVLLATRIFLGIGSALTIVTVTCPHSSVHLF